MLSLKNWNLEKFSKSIVFIVDFEQVFSSENLFMGEL